MSWKAVGKAFASVATYSAKGAIWASQHPEVIASVAAIAGHPEVAVVASRVAQLAITAQSVKSGNGTHE